MDELIASAREAWQLAWVRAAVALLVSVAVSKLVDLIICKGVARLARVTDSDLDDELTRGMHRPVIISVVLVGLYSSLRILAWGGAAERIAVALIASAAVLLWSSAGLRLLSTTLAGLSRLADRVAWLDQRTLPLFDNLGKILVFALAAYGLLVAWDLDLAPWLASAGVVGIAVGFAAKDTLANLFGGLFVIMDAPYKVGDFINLDSGERGRVAAIGLRSTRLLTRDDVEITLPNAHIANSKIVNESGGPHQKTRVAVEVGVAYGSDVDRVRQVLLEAAESVDSVVSDPGPEVRFTAMGDSALIFRVRGWVDEPARRGQAIDGLNTAIYKALGSAGIEIPFPQRVVHLPGKAQ